MLFCYISLQCMYLATFPTEPNHFSPGDRVVAFTWGGCLKCAACRAGYNTICSNKFCPEAETFGIMCDGGLVIYFDKMIKQFVFFFEFEYSSNMYINCICILQTS